MDLTGTYGYTHFKNREVSERFLAARKAAFPDGVPMYQEIGDTAFVTFDTFISKENAADYYHTEELNPDEFVIQPPKEPDLDELVKKMNDPNGGGEEKSASEAETAPQVDTIRLLMYVNSQINRKGSPIKNVVLDLSNNSGGMADAAVFTMAWGLGRANVVVRDTFTGAQTIMRIDADLNLNKSYSTFDGLVRRGYNVWCLTSVNSFSCGNLVPAELKMSEQVPIVGQASGGGSRIVLPCTSASGAMFQISGSTQLSTIRNGSFYNIDQGIEPDVALTNPESYYNREAQRTTSSP